MFIGPLHTQLDAFFTLHVHHGIYRWCLSCERALGVLHNTEPTGYYMEASRKTYRRKRRFRCRLGAVVR